MTTQIRRLHAADMPALEVSATAPGVIHVPAGQRAGRGAPGR
ncbi:MAG: hypothetical protein R2854_10555 [Caldilineaceae bacterium]